MVLDHQRLAEPPEAVHLALLDAKQHLFQEQVGVVLAADLLIRLQQAGGLLRGPQAARGARRQQQRFRVVRPDLPHRFQVRLCLGVVVALHAGSRRAAVVGRPEVGGADTDSSQDDGNQSHHRQAARRAAAHEQEHGGRQTQQARQDVPANSGRLAEVRGGSTFAHGFSAPGGLTAVRCRGADSRRSLPG